ncbi:MAG: hypothetical protein EAZ08_07665 [Cytophagales bacterium]|nr:MAG: hypothetical protein EAZ08_07665 [Cytophagales bacterium]
MLTILLDMFFNEGLAVLFWFLFLAIAISLLVTLLFFILAKLFRKKELARKIFTVLWKIGGVISLIILLTSAFSWLYFL